MGDQFDIHIGGEDLNEYKYSILREEPIDTHDCFVIEAVPSTASKKEETGYSKRILWIRKDVFMKVKVEYYDKNGHQTVMTSVKRKLDSGLPDKLFTVSNLRQR